MLHRQRPAIVSEGLSQICKTMIGSMPGMHYAVNNDGFRADDVAIAGSCFPSQAAARFFTPQMAARLHSFLERSLSAIGPMPAVANEWSQVGFRSNQKRLGCHELDRERSKGLRVANARFSLLKSALNAICFVAAPVIQRCYQGCSLFQKPVT